MSRRLETLDILVSCLSHQSTTRERESLVDKLTSGSVDWAEFIRLANNHLVSPTLWSVLGIHGHTDCLPTEVREYLSEIHRLNSQRNLHLQQQTLEAVNTINGLGVSAVALKGGATLFTDTYPDQGARMLTDIDLLVPPEAAEDCWHALCREGYTSRGKHRGPRNPAIQHHLEPLGRSGEYATIELHHSALPPVQSGRLFGVTLSITDTGRITDLVANSANRIEQPASADLKIPSQTARAIHCLLHSALFESNAHRSGILPLRSLHELATLQEKYGENIDWHGISVLMTGGGKDGLARTWLYLAHRLFGCRLPAGWRAEPKMRMHYARCRLQARWGLYVTLKQVRRIG